jgi:hypothetical protein
MQGTSAANFLSDALLVCERGHISGDGHCAVFSSVGWSSCGGWWTVPQAGQIHGSGVPSQAVYPQHGASFDHAGQHAEVAAHADHGRGGVLGEVARVRDVHLVPGVVVTIRLVGPFFTMRRAVILLSSPRSVMS